MSRKAILIEASKIKGCDDLPGARQDIENYTTWLRSAIGGAWEGWEIEPMSHPSRSELLRYVNAQFTQDYCFITFSGHGHHVKGKDIDDTRICINDTEEVSVWELNPKNNRNMIIADCCRKVSYIEKQARALSEAIEAASAALRPDRARCRQLFDKSVQEADVGSIQLYSCGLNEAAGETSRGGYFSQSMILAGEGWAERKQSGVLRSNDAFRTAAALTTQRNPQQHPESVAGRRMVHFPFSVFSY